MNDIQAIKEKLESVPRLRMSIIPTPIHKLEHVGTTLSCHLFCKRDDLTGFAFGGNKVRKLDYLIWDAIHQGADSIVTFGATQSNWCRMTAAAGAVNGLKVYLVLAGKEPDTLTGNLILDRLAGAQMEFVDTDDEELIRSKTRSRIDYLKQRGHHPYFMAVGGSDALGSLGYLRAFLEISEYSMQTGQNFDHIFVASGSAGTQAGLVTGQLISQWKGTIIGITVSRAAPDQEEIICTLVQETCNQLNFDVTMTQIQKHVICDDGYLGGGYRHNTPGCLEAIEWFARKEGIFLDEVYTGKAAAGLIDYCRTGKIGMNDQTLFIHTGGHVQLFE